MDCNPEQPFWQLKDSKVAAKGGVKGLNNTITLQDMNSLLLRPLPITILGSGVLFSKRRI
ncbi:MAG: hypothetical protein ACI8SR_003558 [Oceanicoccus sp.]|jgi:hypothetical protein